MIYKMSKEAISERIREALAGGDEKLIRQRVEVCLWGLSKSKDGENQMDALIDELGLEKYGAKKSVAKP